MGQAPHLCVRSAGRQREKVMLIPSPLKGRGLGRGESVLRVKRMSLALMLWLLWGAATPVSACIGWNPKADILTARSSFAVAVIGSTIYAAGGQGLDVLEAYDPATDTWTSKAPINDPTPAARWGAAAAAVNGKLYVIGGSNSGFSTLYDTVYEYDPSTDTWAVMASMSVGRAWLAVVTANDGTGDKIYAIGGYINAATFEVTTSVEKFDPPPSGGPTGTWTTVAILNVRRGEFAAAVVNGKIYAVGGIDWRAPSPYLIDSVEEYDPTNDAGGWTGVTALSSKRQGVAAVGWNGLLYVTGGDDDVSYSGETTVEAYDPPPANSWSSDTPMLMARAYHGLVTVDGKLYAIAGVDGTGTNIKAVEEAMFTSVTVVKTQTPANPGIGEPVTYQIVVTNVSGPAIDSLTVVDTVSPVIVGQITDQPAGFGPTVTPVGSGTRYVWSYNFAGMMPPGTSFTFTITGTLGLVCAPTLVSNTAYIVASTVCSTTELFTNAVGGQVQPPVTGITVSKTQTPASPAIGDPVTYQIVVTNVGGATIENLIVVDTVSPVIVGQTTDQPTAFSLVVTPVVPSGTQYEWNASGLNMMPGTSFTFTITGTVGVVSAATAVSNTAYISAASACSVTTLLSNRTDFLAQVPAALEGSLVALLDPAPSGQDFLVTLTVTNMGEAGANGVTPAVLVASGTGGAILKDGPSPVPPVVLAGGGAITFTWTLTAASAGSVWFSNTVTGSDANSGASVSTGVVVSNSITVIAPALAAGLFVSTAQVLVGQDLLLTMMVTNTGSAGTDTVAPSTLLLSGCGGASLIGPTPASVATLVPGAAVTFSWTATADTVGTFSWSGTAMESGGMVSNLAVSPTVGTPTVLVSAASLSPTPVSVGQWVTVSFTATNTGGTPAVSVMPALTNASTAGLTLESGPGAAVQILGCEMHTFTWMYSTNGVGSLEFNLAAKGLDSFSLVEVSTSSTVRGQVQSPAKLTAGLSFSSTVVNAGGSFLLMITVTNTGEATADGLLPPALDQYGLGSTSVTAVPLVTTTTLVGSQSLTWTWTLTASSGGFVYFTATVTGADFNSGLALSTPVITPKPLQIDRPGIGIVDFAAGPTPVGLDQLITVTLFISNTGDFELQGAVPSVLSVMGDGQAGLESGPEPAVAAVPIGGTAMFAWQYRALHGGTVTFQGTVTSAFGGVSALAVSSVVTIEETRKNLDDLVVYPNPFNRDLAVGRTMKFQRMPAFTVIKLYTIAGELVGELNAGTTGLVEWDGRNAGGTPVTPGVYLYMAQSPDGSKKIGKLQVVK